MSDASRPASELAPIESLVYEAVSDEEPWSLLEAFADLERVSGTEDERAAARYLVERLSALGIEHHRYDPELYISQPHGASVEVHGRSFSPGPVKTVSFSAADTVSGPVEYVGSAGPGILESSGDDPPTEPYADVADLSGTIALTAAGSLSIRATRLLEAKGAAGVIAIHEHDSEPHAGIASPIWGGVPAPDDRDRLPGVPIVNVTKPAGAQLRDWAASPDGLEVTIDTDLTTDWFACPVVTARIEAGVETDSFVLLHAHYDSWDVGITDNATGDAGLLELARVLRDHADEFRHDLRIAWWPGHSTGRYAGSAWYADEFAVELAEHCVAHVNMDSPGAAGATEYTDMSCWTPESHPLVEGAIADVTGKDCTERLPFRAGDYSFDNLGITGFFMLSSNIPEAIREERGYHGVGGCGGNSDAWHLSTDTLDKAGREELVRDIRVYAVSLLRVLTAEVLPFDHRRTADRLREAVERYDGWVGDAFDFSPTYDALDELESALETFYDQLEADAVSPPDANDTITALSRVLTRLLLVSEGRFEQDPATGREALPLFADAGRLTRLEDGDERRFLNRQLVRAQNEVVYRLRRARNAAGVD